MKSLLVALRFPIDLIVAMLGLPAALVMLGYRKFGSHRLPFATAMLRHVGVFPIRNHYYEPQFNTNKLAAPLAQERDLPGVDFDETGQLQFLSQLDRGAELTALRLDQPSDVPNRFRFGNGSFGSGDAEYLYQFIRTIRPARIIEIGSGHSTRIARLAVEANEADGAPRTSHVCIEPYEMPWLEQMGVQVVRKKVEECDLDWSNELQAGDLLFIDSSHMIRPQGDVLFEYLQILPRLKSGVYVHVHDIFSPRDYLPEWVVDRVLFWNEQYLLEALMSNTSRYRVVGALNFLKHRHYSELKRVCPYLDADREPGSFYFQVR